MTIDPDYEPVPDEPSAAAQLRACIVHGEALIAGLRHVLLLLARDAVEADDG